MFRQDFKIEVKSQFAKKILDFNSDNYERLLPILFAFHENSTKTFKLVIIKLQIVYDDKIKQFKIVFIKNGFIVLSNVQKQINEHQNLDLLSEQ